MLAHQKYTGNVIKHIFFQILRKCNKQRVKIQQVPVFYQGSVKYTFGIWYLL